MSTTRGQVLVIDDDRNMCEVLSLGLKRLGFAAAACCDWEEGLRDLNSRELDAVVTDLNMPGRNGIAICGLLSELRPDIPVIVFTAFGSLDTAIQAIRAGAYDFITKPFELEALALSLDRAVRFRQLNAQVKRLETALAPTKGAGELLGESKAMMDLKELVGRVAPTDSSVLLAGETGTGKEVIARVLHRAGRRAKHPFVAINCAAVPDALLESELFGHTRGAFTDARVDRKGLLSQAEGGTLFLDEIGDMPIELQPKLLRALQERTFRPVGDNQEIPFDVRIISATHQDLESYVKAGRFREDLYYRLNVITIDVPPLRLRGNDVLLLAQHFTREYASRAHKAVTGISAPAAAKLLAYSWPGNIRELQNTVERAVALTRHAQILVEDLPEKIQTYVSTRLPVVGEDASELVPLAEMERRYILGVLKATGNQRTAAARILGLDRKTLYRKLEQYNAEPRPDPPG